MVLYITEGESESSLYRWVCTFVGLVDNYNWIMLAIFILKTFLLSTVSDLIMYSTTVSRNLALLMSVEKNF